MNNKIEQLKELYQETNKELCELIGNRIIELVDDYLYDEDVVTYWIGAEQYNVKSVCVDTIEPNKDKLLVFNVFLVTTDTEGYIQTYEDQHSFKEIPFDTAIYLLEKVYKMAKGANINEN